MASEVLLRHDKDRRVLHPPAIPATWVRGSGDLGLIGRMDWQAPPQEYLDDPVILWGDAGRARRHVVMQDGSYQWTSAIAFLRKGDPQGMAWLDYARAMLPPGTRASPQPQAFALPYFRTVNGARADLEAGTVRLTTPDQPWCYAVEFPLLADRAKIDSLEIELAVRATGKAVCVGLLSSDGSTFIQEVEVRPAAEFAPVKLAAAKGKPLGSLMVRSSAQGCGTGEIQLRSCRIQNSTRPN